MRRAGSGIGVCTDTPCTAASNANGGDGGRDYGNSAAVQDCLRGVVDDADGRGGNECDPEESVRRRRAHGNDCFFRVRTSEFSPRRSRQSGPASHLAALLATRSHEYAGHRAKAAARPPPASNLTSEVTAALSLLTGEPHPLASAGVPLTLTNRKRGRHLRAGGHEIGR